MNTPYHLKIVLDICEANRLFAEANGTLPDGSARAHEVPFQTGGRAALYVEFDGDAIVVVAEDAPPEDGAALIEEWKALMRGAYRSMRAAEIGAIKSKTKTDKSRENIKKVIAEGRVGRHASTPAGMVRTKLRRALEETFGRPLPLAAEPELGKLMHCNSTPKRRRLAWEIVRCSVPEDKRQDIQDLLVELDNIAKNDVTKKDAPSAPAAMPSPHGWGGAANRE